MFNKLCVSRLLQNGAKAGHLVLVTSRAQEELTQVKLQVRPEGVPSGYQPHCSPLRWAINCNVGLPPCCMDIKPSEESRSCLAESIVGRV